MSHETSPDLKGTVMATMDDLLAALIDWQLVTAWPDADLNAALDDIVNLGDANVAEMVREVRYTLWAAIRTLEAVSSTLHDELDWF